MEVMYMNILRILALSILTLPLAHLEAATQVQQQPVQQAVEVEDPYDLYQNEYIQEYNEDEQHFNTTIQEDELYDSYHKK